MKILPAIDIKGGNCVRLYQGKKDRETIFAKDPVEMAREWERRGAKELHIVDLDGAFEGEPRNRESILEIRQAIQLPIQLGGGIRTSAWALEYLQNGIDRIIVSTMALNDRDALESLSRTYEGQIMVSLDCFKESIAVEGWVKEGRISPLELAGQMREIGITWFIITDIARDGTLHGPNLTLLETFLDLEVQLMSAGGVSTIEDLQRLKDLGLDGAIIGQALYTGDLTLARINREV